jgi:SAM-dependent methyltransferase
MFKELINRKITGKIYHRFILYPKIKKYLTGHLLDYGAGIGSFSSYYKKFDKVTPLEINSDSYQYLLNSNLNPIMLKNNKIPSDNNFYDSALLDNVIEHVLNPEQCMVEIKRVLKNNATIVIGVPGVYGFNSHWDHKYYFDEMELKKLCSKLSLKLIKFFYMPLFKSEFLSLNLKQYCIYAIIKNTK